MAGAAFAADLIHVTGDDYASYREINAFMARALVRFNTPEAVFWIQDYHFLSLGAEMRRLGIERPLGFFLHTPWADRRTIAAVPIMPNSPTPCWPTI